MKKLYFIFILIFLLILSSCGNTQQFEPSPAPLPEITKDQQPEDAPLVQPNAPQNAHTGFNDGLTYLPVKEGNSLEMTAAYLADEITLSMLYGNEIDGIKAAEITPEKVDHVLVIMYPRGLDDEIYQVEGNPYKNWAESTAEGGLRFDAATCKKIAYEVFGIENYEFSEGNYGFTYEKTTDEYVTHAGFSPSYNYAGYEYKIAYPDEKTVAVRYTMSNTGAYMGNEGWQYIGEGKMTFEIMQSEAGEDFLRYKDFQFLPCEYATFWYSEEAADGHNETYDLFPGDCEIGCLYTKNLTTGEITKLCEEKVIAVNQKAAVSNMYYSTGKEVIRTDYMGLFPMTVYESQGENVTLIANYFDWDMDYYLVLYEGSSVIYYPRGYGEEPKVIAEAIGVYNIIPVSEKEFVYIIDDTPGGATTDTVVLYNIETDQKQKVNYADIFTE